VGRRSRRRATVQEGSREKLVAPTSEYVDDDGNVLVLRGSLTAATRTRYAKTLTGNPLSQEDAWQRAMELLFERLATSWTIAGMAIESQRELLARYRAGSPPERAWIRDVLREHCAEHFPELQAP
jgi:hypothetical protein